MPKKESLSIDTAVSTTTDDFNLIVETAQEDEKLLTEYMESLSQPVLEDVDLYFDRALADIWLAQSWQRLTGVVGRVRVFASALLPVGEEPQSDGIIEMAWRAVEPGGVFYVPEAFAGSVVLEGQHGEPAAGGFVRFTR